MQIIDLKSEYLCSIFKGNRNEFFLKSYELIFKRITLIGSLQNILHSICAVNGVCKRNIANVFDMHALYLSLFHFFFTPYVCFSLKDARMRFVNEKQTQIKQSRQHSTHQSPHLSSPYENVETATGALQTKRKNEYKT